MPRVAPQKHRLVEPVRPQVRPPIAEKTGDAPTRDRRADSEIRTMLNTHAPEPSAAAPMPLLVAADLQDNLMMATHDLDRLQALLAHACDELMLGFHGATQRLRTIAEVPAADAHVLDLASGAARQLGSAVTALQFQDMASQLITHTHQRLRSCADRLARETMGDDDDGAALVEALPLRPNPVTQDEMDAGSIELF
jgi:hypothetical protein